MYITSCSIHVHNILPYSWRYWWELNLVVGSQIAIANVLADLNLAVWYSFQSFWLYGILQVSQKYMVCTELVTTSKLLDSPIISIHRKSQVCVQPIRLTCLTCTCNMYVQGSPQEKFKAERMGVVWAWFVTTSIFLVTTSEKYDY